MPWLVTFLSISVLLTGMGQVINGQFGKGIVVILTHWTLALFTCFASVPITCLIAALDAFRIARKLSSGRQVGPWELM